VDVAEDKGRKHQFLVRKERYEDRVGSDKSGLDGNAVSIGHSHTTRGICAVASKDLSVRLGKENLSPSTVGDILTACRRHVIAKRVAVSSEGIVVRAVGI
jgi:hypothetical protein